MTIIKTIKVAFSAALPLKVTWPNSHSL